MPAKTDVYGDLRAPREMIGSTLVGLIDAGEDVVVLDGDLGLSTRLGPVEDAHPERLVQLGVAEQNAMGVATGLSYTGVRPVFVSMAMFALALPWTQLRQAAYAGAPVVVIGTHPGVDMGPDGGTHQCLEDLALARAVPELVVLTPADSAQTASAIAWAVRQSEHPVYIRVGRHPVAQLYTADEEFVPGGHAVIADHGGRALIVTEGSTASLGRDAADILDERGIGTRVVHLPSLKPLDAEGIRAAASGCDLVVTVENHSVIGGLGDAVSGVVGPQGARVERIGTPDVFGMSATGDEMRESFGLTPDAVAARIDAWLSTPSLGGTAR
ncbi:hypothetical protein BHE97_16465 [Aeromicrobium sp. PE09-221]|uniref:transketolase family protein n=1 Tax=Aeromicrobium sp. PE09-221 TaxID=1898043 RepID=UPI000B7531D9|nr:transketolase C-terminal domain-containing protein [Aeromicrobium sp. PE09-221]OUZ07686.1 hypothetical protein BHE97_16465 [Aeromicrobium sp. PE09-221]